MRPGITGWAQINGGNLVTTEEKGVLDEWYIRHASFWLDFRIALLTLRFLFTGERRSEHAVTEAYAVRHQPQFITPAFRNRRNGGLVRAQQETLSRTNVAPDLAREFRLTCLVIEDGRGRFLFTS